jgi:hypothetical protein
MKPTAPFVIYSPYGGGVGGVNVGEGGGGSVYVGVGGAGVLVGVGGSGVFVGVGAAVVFVGVGAAVVLTGVFVHPGRAVRVGVDAAVVLLAVLVGVRVGVTVNNHGYPDVGLGVTVPEAGVNRLVSVMVPLGVRVRVRLGVRLINKVGVPVGVGVSDNTIGSTPGHAETPANPRLNASSALYNWAPVTRSLSPRILPLG